MHDVGVFTVVISLSTVAFVAGIVALVYIIDWLREREINKQSAKKLATPVSNTRFT